jgi:hypothetical protein
MYNFRTNKFLPSVLLEIFLHKSFVKINQLVFPIDCLVSRSKTQNIPKGKTHVARQMLDLFHVFLFCFQEQNTYVWEFLVEAKSFISDDYFPKKKFRLLSPLFYIFFIEGDSQKKFKFFKYFLKKF